jgi:hypothetical protein
MFGLGAVWKFGARYPGLGNIGRVIFSVTSDIASCFGPSWGAGAIPGSENIVGLIL